MKLIGGVIIIGSLIWEDHLKEKDKDFIRKTWRNQNLKSERHFTPVPIRYGRESSTRKHTYTMIFDNGIENLGQGLIFEFQHAINSFEDLERQAIILAKAEGIYTETNQRFTDNWGSVGLLINPNLKTQDLGKYEFLHKKWSDIYRSYKDFKAIEYKSEAAIEPPIDQNGFLKIAWQEAMDNFDILLATPVIPNPKSSLKGIDIANKIIEKKYDTYFKSNIAYKITTFQDEEISDNLPNN